MLTGTTIANGRTISASADRPRVYGWGILFQGAATGTFANLAGGS